MRVALGLTVVLTPEPTLWDVWFRRYEHLRKNFFLVKKSKFWLRSPPEALKTPEMDSSTSQMYPEWFLTKNRPKNRRENRGERRERSFGRFHSGGLRRIYRALLIVSGERKELHDFRRRHFSRISMGMWENLRNRTKQTQKWPKK